MAGGSGPRGCQREEDLELEASGWASRHLPSGPSHSPVVGMGVPTQQLRTPRSWILQGTAGIWFLLYLTPSSAVFTFP